MTSRMSHGSATGDILCWSLGLILFVALLDLTVIIL